MIKGQIKRAEKLGLPKFLHPTKKDGDKNQIIKNINYDQNSLSIF